jgi:crotonobetainyl-CoA:carnitine CoA-transferase CaiB-like acyl-CoA transferase
VLPISSAEAGLAFMAKPDEEDRAMSARTFMSTMAAALMLVGSVAAASAAEPRVHQTTRVHAAATEVVSAPVTQIDQDGNYVINHNQGAIPASPY